MAPNLKENQPISGDKNPEENLRPKAAIIPTYNFASSIHMVQPGGYGCCHIVVVFGASMWI